MIYEVLAASTARAESALPLWSRHFMEAAVVGSGLNDPVCDTRHLGRDSHIGHGLTIGTGWITPEILFELVSKAVLCLTHGDGGRHPEDTA
jgi:hypothetical protein